MALCTFGYMKNLKQERGCADFFFQLNLLPPFLLHSQGDETANAKTSSYEPTWHKAIGLLRPTNPPSKDADDANSSI